MTHKRKREAIGHSDPGAFSFMEGGGGDFLHGSLYVGLFGLVVISTKLLVYGITYFLKQII